MITPEEEFSWRKSDVSHFKIYGAFVYFHVSKESRKNLVSTIELGVLVGYIETLDDYYVDFPSLKMKFVQKHVKFDEEKAI